jgi:probable rRNA maturation factor
VKIAIKNLQGKIPIRPSRIRRIILKVLSKEGARKSGEIGVSFVSDKEICRLNRKFLRKNSPTDVLAFDLSFANARNKICADIVISCDTALRNAKILGTSVDYELNLYLVHGILHLLGYKDRYGKDKLVMRNKEKGYVNS